MPFSFAIAPISAIGWITPISLLAVMIVIEDRLVGDRRAQLVEADAAVLLHRQIRDAVAVLLEALARVDHRLVLGDARDDVVALLAVHLGDALDRQVVRTRSRRS